MSRGTRRAVWPWIALAVATAIVLVFLGSFVWRLFNPPVLPFVESEGEQVVIQVEVVNASGVDRAGRRTMEFLRERGFDVVELSTASASHDTSLIIDRVGDRTSALKVAKVLGIADSVVYSDLDSMLFVRASVVIGKDLQRLHPFRD